MRYCSNSHFRFSVFWSFIIKISCLTGRDLAFYSCWSQIEGTKWNAAACVRSSSTAQGHEGSLHVSVHVPASREAVGLVQSWADPLSTVRPESMAPGWPWPCTSPPSQLESLPGLHCGESPHPGYPRWSSLSVSKLLGGAQYVLTGQHIVCKMPLTSWFIPAPESCTELVALCSWWVPVEDQALPVPQPCRDWADS